MVWWSEPKATRVRGPYLCAFTCIQLQYSPEFTLSQLKVEQISQDSKKVKRT